MNRKRKRNGQIEINNLVDGAIANAVARRNKALKLEELSEQQAEAVKGGLTKPTSCEPPIIAGGLTPTPPVSTV